MWIIFTNETFCGLVRLGQGHDKITVETAHPHNLNIEGKKDWKLKHLEIYYKLYDKFNNQLTEMEGI